MLASAVPVGIAGGEFFAEPLLQMLGIQSGITLFCNQFRNSLAAPAAAGTRSLAFGNLAGYLNSM